METSCEERKFEMKIRRGKNQEKWGKRKEGQNLRFEIQ